MCVCVLSIWQCENNKSTFNVQTYDLDGAHMKASWMSCKPCKSSAFAFRFCQYIKYLIIYRSFRAHSSSACASSKHFSFNAECSYASTGIPNSMKSRRKQRLLWIIQQEKSIESHAKRANEQKRLKKTRNPIFNTGPTLLYNILRRSDSFMWIVKSLKIDSESNHGKMEREKNVVRSESILMHSSHASFVYWVNALLVITIIIQ